MQPSSSDVRALIYYAISRGSCSASGRAFVLRIADRSQRAQRRKDEPPARQQYPDRRDQQCVEHDNVEKLEAQHPGDVGGRDREEKPRADEVGGDEDRTPSHPVRLDTRDKTDEERPDRRSGRQDAELGWARAEDEDRDESDRGARDDRPELRDRLSDS